MLRRNTKEYYALCERQRPPQRRFAQRRNKEAALYAFSIPRLIMSRRPLHHHMLTPSMPPDARLRRGAFSATLLVRSSVSDIYGGYATGFSRRFTFAHRLL